MYFSDEANQYLELEKMYEKYIHPKYCKTELLCCCACTHL